MAIEAVIREREIEGGEKLKEATSLPYHSLTITE